MAEIEISSELQWMLDIDTSSFSLFAQKVWAEKIRDAQSQAAKSIPKDGLDLIRFKVDHHGTQAWCKLVGISMRTHLANCDKQYGKRRTQSFIPYKNLVEAHIEKRFL